MHPHLRSTNAVVCLVEEADDLARHVLSPRLLVVHDAGGGGEDDVAELTRGQELDDPLFHVAELHVVARADDTGLVEAGEVSVCATTGVQWSNDHRPFSWITILPLRWSSTSSNSPI